MLSEESPQTLLTTLTLSEGIYKPFNGTFSPNLNNLFKEMICKDTFLDIICSKSRSEVKTIISSFLDSKQ